MLRSQGHYLRRHSRRLSDPGLLPSGCNIAVIGTRKYYYNIIERQNVGSRNAENVLTALQPNASTSCSPLLTPVNRHQTHIIMVYGHRTSLCTQNTYISANITERGTAVLGSFRAIRKPTFTRVLWKMTQRE